MNQLISIYYYTGPYVDAFLKNFTKRVGFELKAEELTLAKNSGKLGQLLSLNNAIQVWDQQTEQWLYFQFDGSRSLTGFNSDDAFFKYLTEISTEFIEDVDLSLRKHKLKFAKESSKYDENRSNMIATIVWQKALCYESHLQNIIDSFDVRFLLRTDVMLYLLLPFPLPYNDGLPHNLHFLISESKTIYHNFIQENAGKVKIALYYYFYNLLKLYNTIGINKDQSWMCNFHFHIQKYGCDDLIQEEYRSNLTDLPYLQFIGGLTQKSIFNLIDSYINMDDSQFINFLINDSQIF